MHNRPTKRKFSLTNNRLCFVLAVPKLNLQGNLNYKKYTACHTVCHFMYAPLTLKLSPSAKT